MYGPVGFFQNEVLNCTMHTRKLVDNVLYSSRYKEINDITKMTPIAYLANNNLVLLNGDNGGTYIDADNYSTDDFNLITISFRCLARFLGRKGDPSQGDIIDALNNTEVLDFHDERRVSSPKNKKPGPGFVYISANTWHRSANVLLSIATGVEIKYVVMGVDEDQYFGCQLASPVFTVEEAYTSLMPAHIRKTPKENIRRQGEWFFIKLDGKVEDYEGVKKFTVRNDWEDDVLHYYLRGRNDNESSNTHVVKCDTLYEFADSLNINGGKPIPMFANSNITHNQHAELYLSGLWWAIENTAVQSYSEEGVD